MNPGQFCVWYLNGLASGILIPLYFLRSRGLKGKTPQPQKTPPKPQPPQQPKQQQPKPSLVNTFNNDGSFLEQFKRLSEAKQQAKPVTQVRPELVTQVKPEPVKPELVRFNPALPPPSG